MTTKMCSTCHGLGKVIQFDKNNNIYYVQCVRCGGSGVIDV